MKIFFKKIIILMSVFFLLIYSSQVFSWGSISAIPGGLSATVSLTAGTAALAIVVVVGTAIIFSKSKKKKEKFEKERVEKLKKIIAEFTRIERLAGEAIEYSKEMNKKFCGIIGGMIADENRFLVDLYKGLQSCTAPNDANEVIECLNNLWTFKGIIINYKSSIENYNTKGIDNNYVYDCDLAIKDKDKKVIGYNTDLSPYQEYLGNSFSPDSDKLFNITESLLNTLIVSENLERKLKSLYIDFKNEEYEKKRDVDERNYSLIRDLGMAYMDVLITLKIGSYWGAGNNIIKFRNLLNTFDQNLDKLTYDEYASKLKKAEDFLAKADKVKVVLKGCEYIEISQEECEELLDSEFFLIDLHLKILKKRYLGEESA